MLPAELLRRVYEWCPGAGHHATFDYRTAQAMACVNHAWARHARVEILVHRLTVRGRLRLRRGGVYYAPNQISTYEMLVRLQRHYRLSNDQIASLDRDLAARHAAGDFSCGTHAGLNQWSPYFSGPGQLRALAARIVDDM